MTGPIIDRRGDALALALDGVDLDESERAIVDWMTRACDLSTLRALASILAKARVAGRKPLTHRIADRMFVLLYGREVI